MIRLGLVDGKFCKYSQEMLYHDIRALLNALTVKAHESGNTGMSSIDEGSRITVVLFWT